jgi:intracellular multiplication protein IcmO
MRDYKGVAPTIGMLCSTLQLRTMWMLATRRVFCLPPDETGKAVEVRVNDMPESIVKSIRFYLQFMLGLDLTRSEHDYNLDGPDGLHGFAVMHSTGISAELLSSENSQP